MDNYNALDLTDQAQAIAASHPAGPQPPAPLPPTHPGGNRVTLPGYGSVAQRVPVVVSNEGPDGLKSVARGLTVISYGSQEIQLAAVEQVRSGICFGLGGFGLVWVALGWFSWVYFVACPHDTSGINISSALLSPEQPTDRPTAKKTSWLTALRRAPWRTPSSGCKRRWSPAAVGAGGGGARWSSCWRSSTGPWMCRWDPTWSWIWHDLESDLGFYLIWDLWGLQQAAVASCHCSRPPATPRSWSYPNPPPPSYWIITTGSGRAVAAHADGQLRAAPQAGGRSRAQPTADAPGGVTLCCLGWMRLMQLSLACVACRRGCSWECSRNITNKKVMRKDDTR